MTLEPQEIQAIAKAVAEELAANPDLASHDRGPLMTTSQVAKLLNANPASVRRWGDDGALPCLRIGEGKRSERRYPREEILALIDRAARRAS